MAYRKYEYKQEDLDKQFDNIGQSYKDMYDAQHQATVDNLRAQLPQIQQKYDINRANIYSNARLSALGNNERMAANGLSGNAYGNPVSGYSEMSRTSEDNALRNALARASLAQAGAENDIQTQINQAGTSRDAAYAQAMANLALQKLQAAQSERQFGANYNFNVEQAQQAADYQRQQAALEQAKWELSAYGVVRTKASADALGVPVGTTLASLQKKSGGGSSGSRRNGDEPKFIDGGGDGGDGGDKLNIIQKVAAAAKEAYDLSSGKQENNPYLSDDYLKKYGL